MMRVRWSDSSSVVPIGSSHTVNVLFEPGALQWGAYIRCKSLGCRNRLSHAFAINVDSARPALLQLGLMPHTACPLV